MVAYILVYKGTATQLNRNLNLHTHQCFFSNWKVVDNYKSRMFSMNIFLAQRAAISPIISHLETSQAISKLETHWELKVTFDQFSLSKERKLCVLSAWQAQTDVVPLQASPFWLFLNVFTGMERTYWVPISQTNRIKKSSLNIGTLNVIQASKHHPCLMPTYICTTAVKAIHVKLWRS